MRLVLATAVGRLDHHVVRPVQHGWVPDDRRARPPEVAGEHDDPLRTVGPVVAVAYAEADDRRTEDVARIEVRRVDARRDLDLAVVVERGEQRQDGLRVVLGVERIVEIDDQLRRLGPQLGLGIHGRRAGRPGLGGLNSGLLIPAAVAPLRQLDGGAVVLGRDPVLRGGPFGVPPLPARAALGELLVEPPRVEEYEGRQLDRAGRRVDRAGESLADGDREQPAMVEMCVGQQDRVQLARLEPDRDAVPDHLVWAALEHAAVDEHPGTRGRQEEARPGDGRGATKEMEVHGAQW